MSSHSLPTGAEIHGRADFHPVRWMATGFGGTMLLVALMLILGPAFVVVCILALAMFVCDVRR